MARRAVMLTLGVLVVGGAIGCRPGRRPGEPAGGLPEAAQPSELSVYVPCGLAVPFHDAIGAFTVANPGVRVKPVYDNDARLLEMVLEEGKRPDVFVSPGGRELDVLVKQGLVDPAKTVRVGSYKIMAVTRREWPGDVRAPQDLASSQVKTIALPDPERSSMGWYVRQSLQKLGLWEKVRGKVRPTERIITAYEELMEGKVDLTFTYRGCPLPKDPQELASSRVRIAFELPLDSYDEPKVSVGVLKASRVPQAAGQFVSYLGSAGVGKMLIAAGLPDERGAGRMVMAKAPQPKPAAPGKAVVTAFFPDDEAHRDVRAFLKGLPQRFPGRVEVTIHNFRDPAGDPEGFRKWREAGFGCAGILINGKNTFTFGSGRKQRVVRLQRKMGVEWTQEDVLAAVRAELGELQTEPVVGSP